MITAHELRSRILNLIADHVGTYKLDDGSKIKAIAIIPDSDLGYDYPLPGTIVTGCEVVIECLPPQISPLIGEGFSKEFKWQIHLKQWDSAKQLIEPAEKLIDGLPYFVDSVSFIHRSDKLNTIEQAKIQIKVVAISYQGE